MHYYGDEGIDFGEIDNVAYEIGDFLSWGRISVRQCKEKYGTVRVYCHMGFSCFHSIIWPQHMWIHKWWPYKLDLAIFRVIEPIVNKIVLPIQKRIYILGYKRAITKYPHLYKEILGSADFGELFEGTIPGYKHSNFWTEIK